MVEEYALEGLVSNILHQNIFIILPIKTTHNGDQKSDKSVE